MAVQVTVDFTDEQWALIQKYCTCNEPIFDEAGEYAGNQVLVPTEELLTKRFQRDIQDKVNMAYKADVYNTSGIEVKDIFIL